MKSAFVRPLAMVLAAVIGCASASVFAQTPFERNHPRRDQVNDRLQMQNRRIHQQVREGELNHRQARRMHRADRRIRMRERRFARHHHGIITKQEQMRLNRQENHVSRRIGR